MKTEEATHSLVKIGLAAATSLTLAACMSTTEGTADGVDVSAAGEGIVTDERLYQLVRQKGAPRERLFEIRFLDPGAEAFAFTFG